MAINYKTFEDCKIMNDFLTEISKFTDFGTVITAGQTATCLLLSFILSLVVAKVYQATYKGPSFSPAFMITLVMCGMIIGAVMLIIGSNIARAFSLVGALSIIRFRNAVKDPRDVAFIFLVMAIGMACGTGFYLIGITLTAITCIAVLLMSWARFGEKEVLDKILKIQAPKADGYEIMFNEVLRNNTKGFNLLSVTSSKMGTEVDLTFSIILNKNSSMESLIRSLSELNKNLKIEIVGSNHVLDL